MRSVDAGLAAPRSPLAAAHPTVKLCAALATVVLISTFPPAPSWRQGVTVAILLAVWGLARVSPVYVLRRLAAAAPFIALAACLPLVSGLPGAGALAGAVVFKATSAIVLLSILAATTPVEDILQSLCRLGVPRAFALTAVLMNRYLFVLLEEWRGISRARDCRTGGQLASGRCRMWANQAAMVFVRGWDRSALVAQALLTRGFRGEFPRLQRPNLGVAEAALAVALPLAVLLLRLV